jgi:cell wall-associated NlpC family hydrolase
VQHTVRSHRAPRSRTSRWLVNLGLTATLATGITAAVAGPASAAARPEVPTAALWGSTQTVTSGGTVQLWAKLTHPGTDSRIASLTTQLQQWTNKGWKTVATQRVGATGYNGFTVHPDMSRKYRLFFPGWKSVYGAAVSNEWGVSLGSTAAAVAPAAATAVTVTPVAYTTATTGNAVVAAASRQLGKRYRSGGASPSGFDCSGLTQYVYRQFGINLPHSAKAQRNYGVAVSAGQARAGDLVVFKQGGRWGHVGIYLGGGYMLNAPHSGSQVRIEKVWKDTVVYRRLV